MPTPHPSLAYGVVGLRWGGGAMRYYWVFDIVYARHNGVLVRSSL